MSREKLPTQPIDIYVRVSRVKGREGDAFQSPDVQRERCQAQLVARGLVVGETFTDLDQSGGKFSRPEFDKVLARIESGESAGICVATLSRFSRKVKDTLEGIARIEKHGGTFVCIDPPIDTSTKDGRFMLTVFAALNELQLDGFAEQFAGNQATALARGIRIGVAPAGYTKRSDRTLVKVEPDCEKIAAAYRVRAGGGSWSEVARKLEGVGTSRRSGGVWASTAARNLLASPIYKGVLGSLSDGTPVFRSELSVVSASVWDKANARKAEPGRKQRPGNALLAGLLKCGGCGRALTASTTVRRGKPYTYYQCKAGRQFCAARASIAASAAEPHVVQTALILFEQNEPTMGRDADPERVARLEHERDAAAEEISELDAARAAGELSALAYAKALDSAQVVLDAAQDALAEELAASETAIDVNAFRATLETGTVEERRAFLRRLIKFVKVDRGSGNIAQRCGFIPVYSVENVKGLPA